MYRPSSIPFLFIFAPLFYFYIQKLLFDTPITKKGFLASYTSFVAHFICPFHSSLSEAEYIKAFVNGELINEVGLVFVILSIWVFIKKKRRYILSGKIFNS